MSYSYWSLQYSAIQKLILRHDRLWSMAGISMGLARLNEIVLVEITAQNKGTVLVAGGGKFTARFTDRENAEKARMQAVRAIAGRYPMLEFQVSPAPLEAVSLEEAKLKGLISNLNEQKKCFRGYGLSFNPHLYLCEQCTEYPATVRLYHPDNEHEEVCSVCASARKDARLQLKDIADDEDPAGSLTTIERIYRLFLRERDIEGLKVPLDFENLFPESDDRQRIGVWFSDINSMNDKVPLWLTRDASDEETIIDTFAQVKKMNIDFIADALVKTFPDTHGDYLPFRIIVAGGDDLCIVMPEEYILDFAININDSLDKIIAEKKQETGHPLNPESLEEARKRYNNMAGKGGKHIEKNKPYSFGGSFVVCSPHTPFARIHHTGEQLMSLAKQESNRWGNALSWTIMAEAESESTRLFEFEKPVFIDKKQVMDKETDQAPAWNRPDLKEFLGLVDRYRAISSSHRFQIIDLMLRFRGDPAGLLRQLKILAASRTNKSFAPLLDEPVFCSPDGKGLHGGRLASLFELMSIRRRKAA